MLRSDMRDVLRGWLQDKIPSGGADTDRQWTNAELNRFLNLGLRDAQKIIIAVDPEAYKCKYETDITVPTSGEDALYEWPVGTWAVVEVATSSDGGSYTPIKRISLDDARNGRTASEGSFVHYSKTHFMLAPSPSTAVTGGLRVIVAPTLVMADDEDKCPITEPHESLVLLCAKKLALMDVGEPTDKIEAEIAAMERRVPSFVLSNHQPSYVEPFGYDGGDYTLD